MAQAVRVEPVHPYFVPLLPAPLHQSGLKSSAARSDCRGLKPQPTLHSGEAMILQPGSGRLSVDLWAQHNLLGHTTVIESHIQANVPATHSSQRTRPEITAHCFDITWFRMKLTEQHLQSNLSTRGTESTFLEYLEVCPSNVSFSSLSLTSILSFPFPYPIFV